MSKSNEIEKQTSGYRTIYEQYVIDASFLWVLRSINLQQPHYYIKDLAELEERIQNNLDALMFDFELAWDICLEELSYQQAGETFTAAVIAFRSRDIKKIQFIVEHAFSNEDTFKGLISALGWLPRESVSEWLTRFLYSKDLNHKYLSIAVCSSRRKNPGDIINEILTRDDCLAHQKLLIRTLRLIGELKLYAYTKLVAEIAKSDDQIILFWANRTLILLGERRYISNLLQFINETSELQLKAIQVVFKIISIDKGRSMVSYLSKRPEMQRSVIFAIGNLGDPHVIPWLIEKMRDFETAKIAGEAFTLITGIDIERFGLAVDVASDIPSIPSEDNEDDNVDLDEDENLPFPDVNKIGKVWLRYKSRYQVGRRYLMGIDITTNTPEVINKLNEVLHTSSLRYRNNIALAIALLDAQSPYINTKAKIQ